MDKPLAKKFMLAINTVNGDINRLAGVVENIPDEDEKKKYRRAIAEMMSDIFIKLMAPIIHEHPELDPDRNKS